MKMYRAFISSTYVDLKEERTAVMEAVIKANCYPSGMELFSATNDPPIEKIHDEIDNSDIYILIIAGRYGTIRDEKTGLSYTEEEFDYALEKGKHILVFPIDDVNKIYEKSDVPEDIQNKIKRFVKKASEGRTNSTWSDKDDLKTKVLQALLEIHVKSKLPGWIKPDINYEELKTKYIDLSEKYSILEKEYGKLNDKIKEMDHIPDYYDELSKGDDTFTIKDTLKIEHFDKEIPPLETTVIFHSTWNDIIKKLFPIVKKNPYDPILKGAIKNILIEETIRKIDDKTLDLCGCVLTNLDDIFFKITNQLIILDYLIEIPRSNEWEDSSWRMTKKYENEMRLQLAIRKNNQNY